jgi:hypothetical protein
MAGVAGGAGAGEDPRPRRCLSLARIVRRIDEVDASWPNELHLHNGLLNRGGVRQLR